MEWGNGTLTYEFNGSSNSTGIFENVPAGEDQEFVITDVLGCDYISSINVPGGDDTSPVITAPENTDNEACSIAAGLADYSETAVDITGNDSNIWISVVEESFLHCYLQRCYNWFMPMGCYQNIYCY